MNDIFSQFGLTENADVKRETLRSVFLTAQGERALEFLLLDLKFLEPCDTEADMALNNFAKDLLCTVYGDRIEKRGITWYIKKLLRKYNAESPARQVSA